MGPRSDTFLSDLLDEVGRERFAAFWRSEEDAETAFLEEIGIPLEQWTMQWAQRHYECDLIRGPGVPLRHVLVGLLIAGVFIGGSAGLAGRRQIS
jgi:hypothetical protein